MSNSEGSENFGSPLSQFSLDSCSVPHSEGFSDDDEPWWTKASSDDLNSDGEFILLRSPILDTGSFSMRPTSCREPDAELSTAFDKLSCTSDDHCCVIESSSASEREIAPRKTTAACKAMRRKSAHVDGSCPSDSSASTPAASYEDAAAFITQYLQSPVKESGAQLALLRALIIELGVRSPSGPDLPKSLTSARKLLKAEVHINIKEYIATRDKGPSALQSILQPSKNALRKDIQKKGNRASLKWVKKQGLQVLLVTCFS
ncbi:hypothetical protein F5I97DRAFT_1846085 [Phlebopus sp. FC_14]|nr:hypothetical protein F5I97DRAFT_1846085 [Phlebopus sp. FC_14]